MTTREVGLLNLPSFVFVIQDSFEQIHRNPLNVHQSINQSINQASKQPSKQASKQSVSKSVSQSVNRL